jgi:PAS domain S-box-containing protein
MIEHTDRPPLRVLVAGRDRSAEAALARLGGSYELRCEWVDCPQQFQRQLAEAAYDVILTDYEIGAWTALDALEILQRSERTVPCLVVTTKTGDEGAVERALREQERREAAARLEEQIRRAKREWELSFDAIPDPVIVLDNQCVIRRANQAASALFGLTPPQLVGKYCYEVLHGTAEPRPDCPHLRLLQSGVEQRADIHEPHLGKTFAATASPLRSPSGEVLGCVRVLHDITDRKRAEEAVRRANRALQTLTQSNEAIVRARNEAELLRQVCDVLVGTGGYRLAWVGSSEDDESKTVRPVAQAGYDDGYVASLNITWADSERGRGPVGVAIRTGRRCVVRNTSTDPAFAPWRTEASKRGHASAIGLPLIAGSHVFGALAVYAADPDAFDEEEVKLLTRLADDLAYGLVTICGRFEHARADGDRVRLGMAVEQAVEAITITDPDGTIVYVNPAFERVTGYSRTEALGRTPRILKSDKHDREFYRNLWAVLLRGEVWSGRFINRRKDGALYEGEATISPVRDAGGRVINLVSVQRDVTRERQLEQQLHQSQKMEAVGRLAGGIAHDFNNLLTVINGYSEMLMNQTAEDAVSKYGEEIKRAGERAALLTRQLLAFSRRQVLEPQILDLNSVVTSIEKLLRRLIGEDIELAIDLAVDLGRVKADPGQLGQVIMNLAVNSRDAMPKGGKLTLETTNVELETEHVLSDGAIPPGRYVRLAVSDNGCGMSPETQAHIFEPFFSTKEPGKGTGLGLATIYGIVKQSGGGIACTSRLNGGATFGVYLPRMDSVTTEEAVPEPESMNTRGTETILLVEDEEAVRKLVGGVLQARGYSVLDAPHGEAALAIAHQHRGSIHLLLTDVVMPGMGGPELARRLAPTGQELKVLFMSGYSDDAVARYGVPDPNFAFLQKPFTPDALASKVRALLDTVSVAS